MANDQFQIRIDEPLLKRIDRATKSASERDPRRIRSRSDWVREVLERAVETEEKKVGQRA